MNSKIYYKFLYTVNGDERFWRSEDGVNLSDAINAIISANMGKQIVFKRISSFEQKKRTAHEIYL